jgi:hypothetical protein
MIKRSLILILFLSSCATGPVTESVSYEDNPHFVKRYGQKIGAESTHYKYEVEWD